MKVLNVFSVLGLALGTAQAADSSEVAFLTALVQDLKSHQKDYLNFVMTATNVPSEVTALAVKVNTYTDDSYTTLLDDDKYDITSLENFATELPWYSRLASEAWGSAEATGSASDSKTTSDASGSTTSAAKSTSKSTSSSSKTSKSESSTSSSTKNGGAAYYAPLGAVIGGFALALV